MEGLWWLLCLTFISCFVSFVLYKKWRKDMKMGLEGRTVLVTGGADGLGRELCLQLVRLKCRVVVWDVDAQKLKDLEIELKREGYSDVYCYVCDVSQKSQVDETATQVLSRIGRLDILINNAGIVNGKSLVELEESDIINSFKVNVLSNFWTTKAFLPQMIAANRGHIATVCSILGTSGQPYLTDYSSTKFAVCGFHEALRRELKQTNQNNKISTTIIFPAKIKTKMFSGVKQFVLVPELEVTYVARRLIESIACRRNVLYLPWVINFYPFLKLFPSRAEDFVLDMFGVTSAMNNAIMLKEKKKNLNN